MPNIRDLKKAAFYHFAYDVTAGSGNMRRLNLGKIHWIEKKGTCDEGVIKDAVEKLRRMISDAGGWFIENGESLIDWFKNIAKSHR